MRPVLVVVVLAACYKPSAPTGAPCDERAPRCPSGQLCIAGTCGGGLDRIDAPIAELDAAELDAPPPRDGRPPDADPPDATAPLDAAGIHVDYPATVAHCMDPAAPSLTACTATKGPMQLVVDGMVTTSGGVFDSYIRFDVDGQLVGRTVTSVTLILNTTTAADANSDKSGEVWRVTSFTETSLATTAPMKLGLAPIAPSQGPIAATSTVTFTLPTNLVAANQSLYLGMYPLSTDGVNYWDRGGPLPPVLRVDAQ